MRSPLQAEGARVMAARRRAHRAARQHAAPQPDTAEPRKPPMEFKDHYATLGLGPAATPAEIKRAWRTLARRHHPDLNADPGAAARFQAVAEAHEVLIDPDRRAAHDALAQRHACATAADAAPRRGPGDAPGATFRGDNGDEQDLRDVFAQMFGDAAMPGRPRPAPPASDRHAPLTISLHDAFHGARRQIEMPLPTVDAEGRTTWVHRRFEVTIPRGVRAGQRLRLAGLGERGGVAPGDFYLEVKIQPHPLFRVQGADLYFDLPVTPWEAALGADVTAPTPEGPVSIHVPAGSPAGRTLRLKGRGLPGPMPGDLHAVLSIALPPADSPENRSAYDTFSHRFAQFKPRAGLLAQALRH